VLNEKQTQRFEQRYDDTTLDGKYTIKAICKMMGISKSTPYL
jgi:hypothetical protein